MSKTTPLSTEFLYELYATALRQDQLCAIVSQHMRSDYLPNSSFQRIQKVIQNHYHTYKQPPTFAVLSQAFHEDIEALDIIDEIREYDEGQSIEVMTDMLESYIKAIRLQKVYTEVGSLYNDGQQAKAEEVLRKYAEWVASFTLRSSSFVNVAETFLERYEANKRREAAEARIEAAKK